LGGRAGLKRDESSKQGKANLYEKADCLFKSAREKGLERKVQKTFSTGEGKEEKKERDSLLEPRAGGTRIEEVNGCGEYARNLLKGRENSSKRRREDLRVVKESPGTKKDRNGFPEFNFIRGLLKKRAREPDE